MNSSNANVLDCTLRDGGLVNDFRFTDEFVRELYQANLAAGIDYMEFGYKADKDIFPEEDFGAWKFCKEEDIRAIVGENDTPMKISVMADVGRTNIERDILPKKDSVIDMIRVATYIPTIDEAIEMAEYCVDLGYEVTINIMAVSTQEQEDIAAAVEKCCESRINGVYLVDSYGSMYPSQLQELAEMYLSCARKHGKFIGLHAHNNQQLAFANTITAHSMGVQYLDATTSSLGRGAGNCPSELLLGYLQQGYDIAPLLRFIEEQILPLKDSGVVWGYDIPYMLTGQENQHPRTAISYVKEHKTAYSELQKTLKAM